MIGSCKINIFGRGASSSTDCFGAILKSRMAMEKGANSYVIFNYS